MPSQSTSPSHVYSPLYSLSLSLSLSSPSLSPLFPSLSLSPPSHSFSLLLSLHNTLRHPTVYIISRPTHIHVQMQIKGYATCGRALWEVLGGTIKLEPSQSWTLCEIVIQRNSDEWRVTGIDICMHTYMYVNAAYYSKTLHQGCTLEPAYSGHCVRQPPPYYSHFNLVQANYSVMHYTPLPCTSFFGPRVTASVRFQGTMCLRAMYQSCKP